MKLAVRPGSRDVASEAFKVIRGNIDFMIKNDENSNVIMLTSFNPGSGKSYISSQPCGLVRDERQEGACDRL